MKISPLFVIFWCAAAALAEPAIPPGQEYLARLLAAPAEGLPGGWTLRSVKVEKTQVVMAYQHMGDPPIQVRLVHPSAAPPGAPRTRHFAIVGPAEPGAARLVAALEKNIRKQEGPFLWIEVADQGGEMRPPPEPERLAPALLDAASDPLPVVRERIERAFAHGATSARLGETVEAREMARVGAALGRALPEDERDGAVALTVARLYRDAAKPIEARHYAEKALRHAEAHRDEPGARGLACRARILLGRAHDAQSEIADPCAWLPVAEELWLAGDATGAVDLAAAAAERAPGCVPAYAGMARFAGSDPALLRRADALLGGAPGGPDVEEARARVAALLGRVGPAREAVRALVEEGAASQEGILLFRALRGGDGVPPEILAAAAARAARTGDHRDEFAAGALYHYAGLPAESFAHLFKAYPAFGKDPHFQTLYVFGQQFVSPELLPPPRTRMLQAEFLGPVAAHHFWARAAAGMDTERANSILDLERYLRLTRATPVLHWPPPAEAEAMLQTARACPEDTTFAQCQARSERVGQWPWLVAGALAALYLAWRARRGRARQNNLTNVR